MTRWAVTVPTYRILDDQEVHGVQTWIVESCSRAAAERQALAQAFTGDARRHRGGAAVDPTGLRCVVWNPGELHGPDHGQRGSDH
jgi:hypothetical protein